MKENDIHSLIKLSIKSPSDSFTDNLMKEIIAQEETITKTNWRIVFLYISCVLIFILSIIVTIPELSFLNYTIRFSPVFIRVLSILFIIYELSQLHDIRQKLLRFSEQKVEQQVV
jgi:hypothetical protein